MLVIGITGGSGSGKSTVSKLFSKYGAEAIDADVVYHDLLADSDAMLRELGARFPEAMKPDGRLSRKTLAGIVFSDKEALSDLNKIAHKFVIEETERRMQELYCKNVQYICIDAIALFESGLDSICDVTIGVVAPRSLRISRILERDELDPMSASARINAQATDDFYTERCDYIIENNENLSNTEAKVDEIFDLITKGI